MFHDPAIKWKPYPSIIDGTENILAYDAGYEDGVLHLIIYGLDRNRPQPNATPRSMAPNCAFLIEIECLAYAGMDEFMYSVTSTADNGGSYNNKDVYIKEAISSPWFQNLQETYWPQKNARHFNFVGMDICYEVVGFCDPVVRELGSVSDFDSWRLPRLPDWEPK